MEVYDTITQKDIQEALLGDQPPVSDKAKHRHLLSSPNEEPPTPSEDERLQSKKAGRARQKLSTLTKRGRTLQSPPPSTQNAKISLSLLFLFCSLSLSLSISLSLSLSSLSSLSSVLFPNDCRSQYS